MTYASLMHLFHRNFPGKAVVLLRNGDLQPFSFSDPEGPSKLGKLHEEYVGHVLFVTSTGEWTGAAPHPCNPKWAVYTHEGCATPERAAADLRNKVARIEAEELALRANPEAHLKRELAKFDWTAHYSDTPGVLAASDTHWAFIQTLRAQVSPEVWDRLLQENAAKQG